MSRERVAPEVCYLSRERYCMALKNIKQSIKIIDTVVLDRN